MRALIRFQGPGPDVPLDLPPNCHLKVVDLRVLHESSLNLRIGPPPARESRLVDAHGDGPVRAVFAAGIRQIMTPATAPPNLETPSPPTATWGDIGPYKVPLWSAVSQPSVEADLWAVGRWAALSVAHTGVAPEPISIFLLLAALHGLNPDGPFYNMTYPFIYAHDPESAILLHPWLSIRPETVFHGSLAQLPVAQLLVTRLGFHDLSFLRSPRRPEHHTDVTCHLLCAVLLGLACQYPPLLLGPPIPRPTSTMTQAFAKRGCSLLSALYDRRVKAVSDITSRLTFITSIADTDEESHLFFRLFSMRFLRWLKGAGHPSNTKTIVGDDLFSLDQRDPLTRSNLFMLSMLDSLAIPTSDSFRDVGFQINLLRGPREEHLSLAFFHTCFARLDIIITPYVENALLEFCDLDDYEDSTLFDQWLHSLFFPEGARYNRS
ncbi:hypothetical protein B0H15DRAFT_124476 [Mycena belliarum]|uniref:Uncharacterized protein n=1 Tax=Mycena belliarum TaxID=1033014 RepID=A0AAD6UAN9_9AGAR|nr:hypothetical protein B0H15DRAFT_124476 [Mycena belliae]